MSERPQNRAAQWIRAAISLAIVLAAGLLIVSSGYYYLTGAQLPDCLISGVSGLVEWLGGVRVGFESVRVSPAGGLLDPGFDVAGASIELGNPDPRASLGVGRIQWASPDLSLADLRAEISMGRSSVALELSSAKWGGGVFDARGLNVGGGGRPSTLAIESINVAPTSSDVAIRGVTQMPAPGLGGAWFSVSEIDISPVRAEGEPANLVIDSVAVRNVDFYSPLRPEVPPICERLAGIFGPLSGLRDGARAAPERIAAFQKTVLRWLLMAVIVLAAVLFLLKLVPSWEAGNWRARIALAASSVALPLLIYLLGGSRASSLPLFSIGFACAVVMAVALYIATYQKFTGVYHRLAAVILDLSGITILLLLLVHGFVDAFSIAYPGGLTVNRTTADGISGGLETPACEGVNTVYIRSARADAAGLDASFTEFLAGSPAISVASFDLGSASAAKGPLVVIANTAGREVLELLELSASISNISASLDLDQQRFENIAARLKIDGVARSVPLLESLRRVRFLEDRAAELSTTRFALTASALGPRSDPPSRPAPPAREAGAANISLDAALGLDIAACSLPFDAGVGIDIRYLKAAASVARRGDSVQVHDLHTAPGSRVQFRGGSAAATLGESLSLKAGLRDLETSAEASAITVDNVKISASGPLGCSPSGTQSIQTMLQDFELTTSSGLVAGVDQTSFSLQREIGNPTGKLKSRTELRRVSLTATSNDQGGETGATWLTADFPYARFGLAGTASGEILPNRIDGAFDVLISRSTTDARHAENIAFGMENPIRFSANLSEPGIDMPRQKSTLLQTIDSRLPHSALLDFSFHASAADRGAPPRIAAKVRSDWFSIPTPDLPSHFQLNEVKNFVLSTTGRLDQLPLGEDLLRRADLPPLCRDEVGLELNPFRVEASVTPETPGPLVRVIGKAGPEIRIQVLEEGSSTQIGDSGLVVRTGPIERQIRRLSIPRARIEEVGLQFKVNGLQPGGASPGDPALSLEAGITRTPQSLAVTPALSAAGGQRLFGLNFTRTGDQIEFDLAEGLALNNLTSAVKPFLQPLHCGFDWIKPEIWVQKLSGKAGFESGRLDNASLDLTVAPGSVLTADLDAAPGAEGGNPPAHLPKIRIAVKPDAPLTLKAHAVRPAASNDKFDVTLGAKIPVGANAHGSNGRRHEANFTLETEAAFSLHPEQPATSPLVDHGRKLFDDLRRHLDSANHVFGDAENLEAPPTLDLKWDLALKGTGTAKPFVIPNAAPNPELDEFRTTLAIEHANIVWKSNRQLAEHHIETAGKFAATAKLHQDYLILEADSSLAAEYSLDSQPGCNFDFQSPIAIAFRDKLEPATGSERLWNSAAYDSLWAAYKPAFPVRAVTPFVSCRNLTLGDLSVIQLSGPSAPMRIAVGHGNRLQLNLPVSGSMLFGATNGLLQADLAWIDDHASLSLAGDFSLANFQAAALGMAAASSGHLPFVEDEFNSSVNFLVRDLALGREGFRISPPNRLEAVDLPPFDLDLTLSRSRRNSVLPGVLQATSRLNVKLMNEFLKKVVEGVRFTEPPTALRYEGLDLNLSVRNGIIQTDPLFLKVQGVRLYASDLLEIESEIRVHWQREGWALPPYRFADFLSSMRQFTAGASGE